MVWTKEKKRDFEDKKEFENESKAEGKRKKNVFWNKMEKERPLDERKERKEIQNEKDNTYFWEAKSLNLGERDKIMREKKRGDERETQRERERERERERVRAQIYAWFWHRQSVLIQSVMSFYSTAYILFH